MFGRDRNVPRWVLIYIGFLALLSLGTAMTGYLAPEKIFVNTGIQFDAIQPVTFFYATRNVGIFALCVFGLLWKDVKVLFSVLLLRFVVELLDLIFTLKFAIGGFDPYLVVASWSVIFLIPELLGALALYRRGFADNGWR